MEMAEEANVIIVGAGPAGLAASACLNRLHISNILLEREDCCASLWKKRSYDRLKLHLAKEFCALPYMPFPPNAPRFVPRIQFIQYLENYVSHFQVNPQCNRCVVSAEYDQSRRRWKVVAENSASNTEELYFGKYLVAATGENSEGFIPNLPGLNLFGGDYLHSSEYRNGNAYKGKNVLVVGCGNSGMEIAYDLQKWGAKTSIAVRSPVHILNKNIVWLSMTILKFHVSIKKVDKIATRLAKLKYGNLSKYGLPRPKEGPFYLKATTGRSATIDVGCLKNIKKGKVKVYPTIKSVDRSKYIEFNNGDMRKFDAIIFATGYRSTVRKWLKDGGGLFDETGLPTKNTNSWKGENGLYGAGFARQGLFGIAKDARNIAEDIKSDLTSQNQRNN
ncbi:probable indole-3-pyruvate monooxygenase YUCCA11 [Pistacia vera]|uniref:probable indole-3-pyruvate monooxygenase YUCCA11 n=1 Tax=Pistacia vera TaxID=55513 RepID=UPI001263D9AF|nr:probable indole-3-pyruvate monooxygenase YUCCA11 [Pistacia vera]